MKNQSLRSSTQFFSIFSRQLNFFLLCAGALLLMVSCTKENIILKPVENFEAFSCKENIILKPVENFEALASTPVSCPYFTVEAILELAPQFFFDRQSQNCFDYQSVGFSINSKDNFGLRYDDGLIVGLDLTYQFGNDSELMNACEDVLRAAQERIRAKGWCAIPAVNLLSKNPFGEIPKSE